MITGMITQNVQYTLRDIVNAPLAPVTSEAP